MLAPDERRWWPWLPLLAAQGLYAKLRAGRPRAAREPQGRCGAGDASLRLAGLGDSIIAGIGVERHVDGLTGQVAARVAASGLVVEWNAIGAAGATTRSVLDGLLPQVVGWEPDLVVLSLGVNDAVRGVAPAEFKSRLRGIVEAIAASPRRPAIVFAGIPPLDSFPALPRPLATLLGDRSRRLQQRAVDLTGHRGLKVVSFPPRIAPAAFAADGFHPGPAGCATWAGWVADGFALRVAASLDARGA